MHGFDIEQLRTFVAAVDAGSLTAAAPLRFLSQSSLSEQLRKLEERAGQQLLLRARSGVQPTAAGTRLLVHARQILALSDTAWRDMHGAPVEGELRLAVTDYFRPSALTRLLARLAARHPRVRLHVRIDKSDAIEAAHARGEADIAVTMRIADASTRGGATLLRREPLAWVGGAASHRRKGEMLRLVVLEETCALRRFAVALLARRKIPYVVAHVASGVAGVQSAVAAGLGVACLNASAWAEGGAQLAPVRGLPALPQVVFRMLPAREGEGAVVDAMRHLVAEVLA